MKKSFVTAAVKRTVHAEERSRPENRWEWVSGKRRRKVGKGGGRWEVVIKIKIVK